MKLSQYKVYKELLKEAILKSYEEAPYSDVDEAWKRFEKRMASKKRRVRKKRIIVLSSLVFVMLLVSFVSFPARSTLAFRNAFVSVQKWGEKTVHFFIRPNVEDHDAKTSPPPEGITKSESNQRGTVKEVSMSLQDAQKNLDFHGRVPSFLPESYRLSKVYVRFDAPEGKATELRLMYENDRGQLLSIFQEHLSGNTAKGREASTEDGDQVESVMVQGVEGQLSTNGKGRTDLQWMMGEILYKIYSVDLSKEMLLKIADSVH